METGDQICAYGSRRRPQVQAYSADGYQTSWGLLLPRRLHNEYDASMRCLQAFRNHGRDRGAGLQDLAGYISLLGGVALSPWALNR